MAFLIGGANSAADTGYDVANSCRFNDDDSAYMSLARSDSRAATNVRKFTFSAWVKRSSPNGVAQNIYHNSLNGDNYMDFNFSAGEQLWYNDILSGGYQVDLRTNRLFRDVGAWYHLVLAVDTTQGVAANRVKLYVNGVQETSFATETYPDQNDDLVVDGGDGWNGAVGRFTPSTNQYFDGYMSEVVYIDGTQNAVTDFGEFNSESPTIWQPIDVSGLTFGNIGFYLDFEDSGNLGDDESGNTTDWTENNIAATDQTTDTPTNNFATLNTLIKSTATFSEGNTRYQSPASNPVFGSVSTIGTTKGKWYAEVDYNAGSNHYLVLGIGDENFISNGDLGIEYTWDLGKGQATASIAYVVNTGAYRIDNSNTNWGSAGGDGNIIMIAVDQDNEEIYFGVDGTWGNSSDPAAGSNGIDVSSVLTGDTWFIGCTNDTGASETIADFNFGNPSFSISSSNSDANGYGSFEFAVPSGFYALNTKNLATYG